MKYRWERKEPPDPRGLGGVEYDTYRVEADGPDTYLGVVRQVWTAVGVHWVATTPLRAPIMAGYVPGSWPDRVGASDALDRLASPPSPD